MPRDTQTHTQTDTQTTPTISNYSPPRNCKFRRGQKQYDILLFLTRVPNTRPDYPGYYLFASSTTHLRPRFRGQSADSRGTIFLILWLDKLGTASHFHLTYEVPQNLFPFSSEIPIFIEIPREWRRFEPAQPESVCKERIRAARSNCSATAAPFYFLF